MKASRTTTNEAFHEFLATNCPEHGLGEGKLVLLGGVGGQSRNDVVSFSEIKASSDPSIATALRAALLGTSDSLMLPPDIFWLQVGPRYHCAT
jgi:hypothetical protein